MKPLKGKLPNTVSCQPLRYKGNMLNVVMLSRVP